MITLITGQPGAGKTAMAVKLLLEEAGTRPIFVMGIPDLKIDHQPTPPVDEWTREVPMPEDPNLTRPEFTFPPNSIIVVDESQNVYRPRSVGSRVPPYVAAFETHRHTGVDFWLITQSPNLIDSNVRRLVGRHIHVRSTAMGRYLYEWPEAGDPESKASRDIATRRRYKLPKKAFGLYKSATVHLKTSKRMPFLFWVFLLAFPVFGFLAWSGYQSVQAKMHPERQHQDQQKTQAGQPSHLPPGQQSAAAPVPQQAKPVTAGTLISDAEPRLVGQPETAPMYDQLRQVRAMPVVAACVSTANRCGCFTQQGTPVGMDDAQCREMVRAGRFNPYDQGGQPVAMQGAPLPQTQGQPINAPATDQPQAHDQPQQHAVVAMMGSGDYFGQQKVQKGSN